MTRTEPAQQTPAETGQTSAGPAQQTELAQQSMEPAQALAAAARRALRAPSILNTQPWRWRVRGDELELFADSSRQLTSIDPTGRLLTLSCGAALHHARVALTATGYDASVERFPNPDDEDLLARIRIVGQHEPPERALDDLEAMRRRHTDRRPFAATVPVPAPAVAALSRAADDEDAWLHQIPVDDVPALAAAVSNAGGLGSIAIGSGTLAQAREAIGATRALTARPFQVNVFCHAPARRDAAVEAAWIRHMAPLFAEFGASPPAELREIYPSFIADEAMLRLLLETLRP